MPGFSIPLDSYNRDNCEPRTERTSLSFSTLQNVAIRPNNTAETARNHRFRVTLSIPKPNSDNEETIWQGYAKKCQRPTAEFDVITIHQGGEEIYKPGKMRWNPIDITFYEVFREEGTTSANTNPISKNNTAEGIYNWWANVVLAGTNHYKQRDLTSSTSIEIDILDGSGKSTYSYKLFKCFPVKITPADFDYTDTNIGEYTVTVKYDYAAELEPINWDQ